MLVIAVKTFPYYRPQWAAIEDVKLETVAYEAENCEEALERALVTFEELNPLLACLPGRIQLYRLEPAMEPLTLGVNMDSPQGAESEEEHV